MNKRWIGYIGLTCVVLFTDRITKLAMIAHGAEPIPVLPGFWFELTYNRGVSWGMLSGTDTASLLVRYGLVSIALGALAHHVFQRVKAGKTIWAETLIFAGAIGNGIDRFVYGAVVDFIAIGYAGWVWPIFNVADSCIVCGIALLVWSMVRE